MARKLQLREQRTGTIINLTSKKQESIVGQALKRVITRIDADFGLELKHEANWRLRDIVAELKEAFPEVPFHYHHETSSMRPDGGILSIVSQSDDERYPILITEVKNQGTNHLRLAEGLKKQAKGNAIERLGKNVIGFRTAMMSESILPFVCFGDGCDFEASSSILDRVSTIAMFGPLNTVSVVNPGPEGIFNRGSFFFRPQPWTAKEMENIMLEIAKRSIHYYFARYGDGFFRKRTSQPKRKNGK